jgi:hypothetical protein
MRLASNSGGAVEVFDYIIMAVGGLLIVIGVLLFASGNRESANSNQVEGFGIKLNVSNPSIILIVLGIGLLLVPRLLPTDAPISRAAPLAVTSDKPVVEDMGQAQVDREAVQPATQQARREQPDPAAAETTVALTEPDPLPAAPPVSQPTSAFMPVGTWQLVGYEEDQVDMSGNVQASIYFEQQSPNQAGWVATFLFADAWGNIANYQYQGLISSSGSAHVIAITASNAPNFFAQGATPLDLKMEDGEVLHMAYSFNGSDILLHWVQ